jgi:hypothetical protein
MPKDRHHFQFRIEQLNVHSVTPPPLRL